MVSLGVLIASVAVALVAGASAGWFIGMRRRPAHRQVIEDLETRLERAVDSRAEYETEVREHFAKTADLLNQLTADYRSVYQHIASGADRLCDGEVVVPTQSLAQTQPELIPDALVDVQQPLDYAPRKSPDEHGQLSENFGLEKATAPNPPESPPTAD